jgi:hypothetical protein
MTQALPARFLASAALAVVTTMVLFLTMKVLVTGQDYEIAEAQETIGIDFVQ